METGQDPGGRGSATYGQESVLAGWRKGCLSPTSSILKQARTGKQATISQQWETQSGGGGLTDRLSHLGELSSWSISIRKEALLCLGLSPCHDKVHKGGQAPGTEAFSICGDSVGYHSCHPAGAGPPPLPTLPLETAATHPLFLFSHNVSIVTWQVFAERHGWSVPAG